MDSTTLEIFLVVADRISVTGAASEIGRAPSNVTNRIRALEGELGVDLFSRAEIVERLERSFALASENDGGLASEIEDIRDRLGRVRDAVVARETDEDRSQNS